MWKWGGYFFLLLQMFITEVIMFVSSKSNVSTSETLILLTPLRGNRLNRLAAECNTPWVYYSTARAAFQILCAHFTHEKNVVYDLKMSICCGIIRTGMCARSYFCFERSVRRVEKAFFRHCLRRCRVSQRLHRSELHCRYSPQCA